MTPVPDSSRARPVLLVVEDRPELRDSLWGEIGATYEVRFASGDAPIADALASGDVAVIVVVDDDGDAARAHALRERLVTAGHGVPMILMTAHGDEDVAVEALRRGFTDYIVKRDTHGSEPLQRRIGSNLELARLKRENEHLQRAIEESQARLFNVYDSLDDVIMQIDEDCRVQSLNRSAAALANTEPRHGVGKVCWELFDFYPCEQRRLKESCHIYRTFIEGETIRGERQDAKTHEIHQYMTFITTLKDRDYTVYRETDITEKRRLEEKIAAALRSLGADPDSRPGP